MRTLPGRRPGRTLAVLRPKAPGDRLELTLLRGDQDWRVTLTLAERTLAERPS